MPQGAKKAVLLLSGGLDSATVAALALDDGYEIIALSFDYGQRQKVELDAARRVAESLGIREHRVLFVDLASYGGSALTADIEVPKDRTDEEIGGGVPVTYVPARNTILLAHALGLAEAVGAFDIFIGVNAVDFSGYPDCRPAFVQAFERLANIATGAGTTGRGTFRVHAPLLSMTKAEIIRRGVELGVDYTLTHSCYDPAGDLACGRCDACLLRRRGFEAAGVPDPTRYATGLQERSAV